MNRAPIPKISIGINRDRVRNVEARTINIKMMVMIPLIMFSTFYPGFPPAALCSGGSFISFDILMISQKVVTPVKTGVQIIS